MGLSARLLPRPAKFLGQLHRVKRGLHRGRLHDRRGAATANEIVVGVEPSQCFRIPPVALTAGDFYVFLIESGPHGKGPCQRGPAGHGGVVRRIGSGLAYRTGHENGITFRSRGRRITGKSDSDYNLTVADAIGLIE